MIDPNATQNIYGGHEVALGKKTPAKRRIERPITGQHMSLSS
jgi:hypothetical protein